MRKLTNNLLAVMGFTVLLMFGAQAASITDLYITPAPPAGEGTHPPGEGTSNTIYTIHFNWHEEDEGRLPEHDSLMIGTYVPYEGFTWFVFPEGAGKGVSPMADEGILYEFRMTAGLDLIATNFLVKIADNPLTYSGAVNADHGIQDLQDVFYMPGLIAKDPVEAMKVYVKAVFLPTPEEDADPEPQDVGPVSCDVIVHDSHPWPQNRWAGQKYDRDFLYAYYAYGDGIGTPKPIQSYGLNENFQWREPDDAPNPDDGSTSTCWEFRVIYRNTDNLPPIPYLSSFGGTLGDDHLWWHRYNDEPWDSGVVLYIKNTSWSTPWNPNPDFVAAPMRKVDQANNNYAGGVEYFYILEPAGWLNEYVGLPIGEYEWFIACSDDYIRTKAGDIPSWLDHELELLPSFTLLPKRAVTMPLNRSANTWPSYMSAYNSGLYLDRPTLQPGVTNSYVLKATDHPVISLGLRNPNLSLVPWEATVDPLYRIVNPQTGHIQVGGAQNQKWDFQIKYQHLYGILPEASQGSGYEISVWINDSNQINPDPTRPDTVYRRYTLKLDKPTPSSPNPTADEIKNGVIYHLPAPIQLDPGPHSYFFTASDGQKRARYPVDGHGHYYTGAHAFDGPYVNNKPVLENPAINPPTGTAGDKFRYSVTYKDADNQRPYTAKIYIEYATGQVVVGEMIKENPADNDYDGVGADADADPANAGVKYIFDTANMAQQFEEGQRRFYFEFTDDWGAPSDPRDRRRGEAVYWQSARPESWIFGPYINRNTIPQLLDGSVIATDGANNSATLFEYKVRYIDIDNHDPKYLDVYIGQVQADGTIQWDNGHRMDPIDPGDTVYSGDGVWFRYYSHLTGDAAGRDYYYCMVASDRYDVAEYDAQLSPSAGTVWFTRQADGTPIHKGERQIAADENDPIFTTTHKPIVGPIPSAPTYNPYVSPLLFDAAGNQVSYDSVDYINGIIDAQPVMPSGDIQYWFATAGPTDVGVNNPPSLSGGSVSPDPGESTSEYTYRVTYTDLDGTMGQPPYFIRVRIDGIAFAMERAAGGEPNYKNGVTYFYRTTALTPQLPHHYYFEASDGSGFAVLDNAGSRSSDVAIGAVTWIPGPYVNNKPTLTAPAGGAVYPIPSPGTPISTSQWLNFGIVYTDRNNEWPATGSPVVFIRKVNPLDLPVIPPPPAPEPANDFKVQSVSGNIVTAVNPDDSDPTWALDQFKGLPLQFTNGAASGTTYRVSGNTANTVTLLSQTLPGVAANNTFSIGKIQLTKDANDNNCADGTTYSYRINSLGEGDYALHFMSSTDELIGENNLRRTTVLRYPAIGEITGLKVTSTAPVGNQAPVLSKGPSSDFVNPSLGLSGGLFTFKVTYSDANGDAPIFRQVDYVTGYVRLIIDGVLPGVDMTGPALPNYVTGAEFTSVVDSANPLLIPGKHTFYFEASDGWVVTRYPAIGTADLEFYINRKPVLENPAVAPTYGNAGMDYTFTVTYKDADNRGPDPILGSVLAWVNGTSYPMTLDTSGGTDFVAGVHYAKTLHGSDLIISNTEGANKFYFTANDGLEPAIPTVTTDGPLVHVNNAPELTVPQVQPTGGHEDTEYRYSVIYSDVDGDQPEFVKLDIYIGGVGAPLTFDMVKAANENDFKTGVTYTYLKKVDDTRWGGVKSLPVGNHSFAFRTKDFELPNAVPCGGIGPGVSIRPIATLVVDQPTPTPSIDDPNPTTLRGRLVPDPSQPIEGPVSLTINYWRPGENTQDPPSLHTTVTAPGLDFSTLWKPDAIGYWTIQAVWAGNDDYGRTAAQTVIQVSGPRKDNVIGLSMISIPVDPANGFPGAVFGDGSYALAQWRPLQSDYAYYRSVPGQPGSPDLPLSDIVLGGGYWIKVYGGALDIAPSGNMASLMSNFEIHLDPGWNQIGCPFNGTVNWSALKVRRGSETLGILAAAGRGWIRSYGWAFQQSTANPYTGEYRLVDPTRNGALTTLEAWRGYWIKAMTDCFLVVPPPGTLGMDAQKPLSVETVSTSGWEVNLTATVDGKSDASNGLGSAVSASKVESPGYLDGFVDLYFTDEKGGIYAYDIRSKASRGETWYFKVATDQTNGLMELSWDRIETMPIGSALILVDEATGQSSVMKPGGVYTFPAADAAGGRLFRVILGAK